MKLQKESKNLSWWKEFHNMFHQDKNFFFTRKTEIEFMMSSNLVIEMWKEMLVNEEQHIESAFVTDK